MSPARILLAFLVAPLVPAAIVTFPGLLVTGFASNSLAILEVACKVSYAHAVVLGVPAYFLLGRKTNVTVAHAGYMAFFIGIIPVSVFIVYSVFVTPSGNFSSFEGGITIEGLTSGLSIVAIFGVMGLIAGVVWGKIAGAPSANQQRNADSGASAPPPVR